MHRAAIVVFLLVCAPAVAIAGPAVRLTEAEVIQRVLQSHLQIQAAEEDARIVAADLRATQGVFDTKVAATVDHRIDKSSQSAPAIFGTRTDSTRWDLETTKTLPTGTETGLSFANTRKKVVGSAFMNPLEYAATVTMSVRQPLLKNVAGIADRRAVAQARAAVQSADLQVQRRVHEALRSTLGWYWRTAFAQREVAIAQQAVTAAQAFLAITEERYRLGTADGTDLLAAKANVASRAANVLAARTAFETVLRGLKTELQIPVGEEIVVAAGLPPAHGAVGTADGVIAVALAERPDYLAMRHRLEQMQLRLDMAQNKRWPSLDLVSSLALNQLAMTSYGDAVRGMDNPDVLVGLQLQVPLENQRARGERDRARHEQARALIDFKALENLIVQEIAERVKTVRLLGQQVDAQRNAETLQHSRLGLQQEKYQLGRSSSLDVIRAQDDYLAARLATVRAHNEAQQAWLDYRLATAQLP